jgi:hypothetical protein
MVAELIMVAKSSDWNNTNAMCNTKRRFTFWSAIVTIALGAASNAMAEKIGVAAAVVNQVQGVSGGNSRPLSVGSDVFAHEHIRTSDASTAQLLFFDKTSVSIGPRADLVLDSFVYNPNQGGGKVVINAVQGAFRFITGSQNPRNYAIKTPVATVGIRGTVLDLLITGNATIGYTLTIISVECCAIVTLPSGHVINLTTPGTAYVFTSAGGVTGPVQWDGTIINGAGGLQFPLFGWSFQGEPPSDGLPTSYIGTIDQLNAVIAGQLKAITPPPNNNNYSHGN